MESFSIKFYSKKKGKGKKVSIYMRVTYCGERTEISMKFQVYPEEWSKEKQRVIGHSKEVKIINKTL